MGPGYEQVEPYNQNTSPQTQEETDIQTTIIPVRNHRVVIHSHKELRDLLSSHTSEFSGVLILFIAVKNWVDAYNRRLSLNVEKKGKGRKKQAHRIWTMDQLSIHIYPVLVLDYAADVQASDIFDVGIAGYKKLKELYYQKLPNNLPEEVENLRKCETCKIFLILKGIEFFDGHLSVFYVPSYEACPIRPYQQLDDYLVRFILSTISDTDFMVENPAIEAARKLGLHLPMGLTREDKILYFRDQSQFIADDSSEILVEAPGQGKHLYLVHEMPLSSGGIRTVVAYPNRQRDNPVILFTSSYGLKRVEIAEPDDQIYLAVTQNGDRGLDVPVKFNISYTLYEEPLVLELERLIESTSAMKLNPYETIWLRKDIAQFKHAHSPIVRLPYPNEQAIFLVARGIARVLWELQ